MRRGSKFIWDSVTDRTSKWKKDPGIPVDPYRESQKRFPPKENFIEESSD